MSKLIDDGGSVYPYEQSMNPDGKWNQTGERGITRRDRLADMILAAYCANPHIDITRFDDEQLSEWAYRQTDVQIARGKVKK